MSKLATPTGPKQSQVGSLINGIFDLNANETVSLILQNRQQLNLDDNALNKLSELVRASNEKCRGAALDQIVKLYS